MRLATTNRASSAPCAPALPVERAEANVQYRLPSQATSTATATEMTFAVNGCSASTPPGPNRRRLNRPASTTNATRPTEPNRNNSANRATALLRDGHVVLIRSPRAALTVGAAVSGRAARVGGGLPGRALPVAAVSGRAARRAGAEERAGRIDPAYRQ